MLYLNTNRTILKPQNRPEKSMLFTVFKAQTLVSKKLSEKGLQMYKYF